MIGRVQHMINLPSDPKLVVECHRPGARRAAGLGEHERRNALAPAGYGPRFVFHFTPTSCSWLNAHRASAETRRAVVDLQAAIHR